MSDNSATKTLDFSSTIVQPVVPNQLSIHIGVELRDYFAAHALAVFDYKLLSNEKIAAEAYLIADAMLKARETGTP